MRGMGKKSKLRKLVRQEIRAVLAEMAEPPEGLVGGLVDKMFGKSGESSEERPLYPVGVPFHSIQPYLPKADGPSITTTDTWPVTEYRFSYVPAVREAE